MDLTRRAAALVLVAITAAVGAFPTRSMAQEADVWTLKLALVEKIATFLEWPDEADLSEPEQPFLLTFYGDTPLEARARQVYSERRFRNHQVVIRSAHHPWEIQPTHVLFVAGSSARALPSILQALDHAPVLVVGDSPGMASRGAEVNLYQEQDRIRFEINRAALARAHIRASFRLLGLARLVDESEP